MHEQIRQKYFQEPTPPTNNKKTTLLVLVSLLLIGTAVFVLFNGEWIKQQFSKPELDVAVNVWEEKPKENVDVNINIKEQEVKEDLVSNSHLDYLKIKLEGLFPFYEVDTIEALKFSELVEKKFSAWANKPLREAFNKVSDETFKNLVAYNINYKIKDLDAKALVSEALSDGAIGENALSILQQLYEKIKWVKLDTAEKQTMLAYLTQKIYADEELVWKINKELKRLWTFFSSYLLIFHQENTQEYMTFKEYLTQERDVVEQVLTLDKLPQFDLFIDYKGDETKSEIAMIDNLIGAFQKSSLFKQMKKWEKANKKTKETYAKAEEFIKKLEVYKAYLTIVGNH